MRSIVQHDMSGPWQLEERTRPRPGSGQVVVRVLASGVCRMDVRQMAGEMGDTPRIPGHEFVGEVVAIGPETHGFAEGDRVGVTWHQAWCRTCRHCTRGRIELCRAALETGIYVDGGHAEYAVADATAVVRVDPNLPAEAAAVLCCSGYVAYSAMVDSGVRPSESVGIFGFGGIGHLATQYARAFGAEVTAVTSTGSKVEDARRLGADHVVLVSSDGDESDADLDERFDVAVVTSDAPDALMRAIGSLAPYGRLVVVAAGVEPVELVTQRLLHYKLRVIGASQGPRHRFHEMMQLHHRAGIEVAVETFPLDDWEKALTRISDGNVRYRAALIP